MTEAPETVMADPFAFAPRPKSGKREMALVLVGTLCGLSGWAAWMIAQEQMQQAAAMRELVEVLVWPFTTFAGAMFGVHSAVTQGSPFGGLGGGYGAGGYVPPWRGGPAR